MTLVGRLSQPAEEQVLPERDGAVEVPGHRGAASASAASRVTVDALDCVVWSKRPARSVAKLGSR